jgi:hypothetical protein
MARDEYTSEWQVQARESIEARDVSRLLARCSRVQAGLADSHERPCMPQRAESPEALSPTPPQRDLTSMARMCATFS